MQMTDDFDPIRVTRSLLRRARQGALATLSPGSGDPYCSLVAVASHPDGAPILLISRLALHTKNLLADPRVSLMLDERAAGDPLEGARIMLGGIAEPAPEDELAMIRGRYLRAHPGAEVFVGFKDFSFFRIRPTSLHLVAGFGRIIDLAPNDFLTDLGGAAELLEAEESAVAHMNVDHRDTLELYATQLAQAEPGTWLCTGIDPDGFDLQNEAETLRIDFSQRITMPAALRKELRALADRARAMCA